MTRSAEMFAIAAVILLVAGLLGRFLALNQFVVIQSYAFSVRSVCICMAAFLCVFAATYSFWILPLNQKAAMWHFWLTSAAIVLFWLGIYFVLAGNRQPGDIHGGKAAMAIAWLTSFPLLLVAQGIFLVNVICGLMRLRAKG